MSRISCNVKRHQDLSALYVFSIEGGLYKVGHSRNIELRIKTVKYDLGLTRLPILEYVLLVDRKAVISIERIAHYILSDADVGRELFAVSLDQAVDAIHEATRLHDLGNTVGRGNSLLVRDWAKLTFRVPPSLVGQINRWRQAQDEHQTMSEAVRSLLEAGLQVSDAGGAPCQR